MIRRLSKYRRRLALLLLILPTHSLAENWSSCESDLSRVSRQARNAESEASDMQNLEYELDRKKSDYEDCLMFPDTFDLMDDGCENYRYDYNRKVNEYNNGLSEIQGEMETLIRRANTAISSCN
jgi:hypothetical protein